MIGNSELQERMAEQMEFALSQTPEALAAENAKLRDERREYQATIDSLVDECADHRSDNAKLRELVRDLWEACPADGYYCIYHCEHYDKESESHCKLEDRMRELGVEVDE